MTPRALTTTVAVLALSAVLVAPWGFASEAADPSTFTIGVGAVAETLDPHLSLSGLSILTYANVFTALTVVDFSRGIAEIKPGLASSWKLVSPTTWEFALRRDVQFSNGEPFNAETVKFTVERVHDSATRSPVRGRIPNIEAVQIVDPYTVRILSKAPDPILPKRMAVVFMVPPKYMQQVGAKQFGTKPVGTGFFCVDRYVPLQEIVLVPCPRSGAPAPRIKQVRMVQIPEAASRVAALRSGGVQAIQNVPLDQVDLLKKEGFQIKHAIAGRTTMLMLRAQSDTPLKDRNVRLALSHAVDSDAIFTNLVRGFGALANGQPIGPDGFGHNPAIKPYRYDPGAAKDLLAKAGYPNGFTIPMDATNGVFVADRDIAQSVQAYFSAVGVTLKEVTVEFGEFQRRTDNGTHEPIFLGSYNYFPIMDGDFVLQWFWSKSPAKVGAYPEFDRAFEASRSEMDTKKREELLRQASKILQDEAGAVFLFRPPDIYAVASGVSGFTPRPDLLVLFDQISVGK
jgi:peptide/nickel transport system substrate-binding protein